MIIKGNTVGTPTPRSDLAQTNPRHASYVHGKEDFLQQGVNDALAKAKASGEFDGKDGKDGYTPVKGKDYFDGKDGQPGSAGKDGITPTRGVDYWTEADKVEMVGAVLATDTIVNMQTNLDSILADLNYVNIAITQFSVPGAGTYEIGAVVAAPIVEWGLNKEPTTQVLNGETLGVGVRSKQYSGNVTSTKTYTLTVTGKKGEKATQSKTIAFYHGVYYGAVEDGADINSAAILKLSKNIQGGRGVTFTVSPTSKVRIAYAIPATGYGTPTFKDANSGFQVDMTRLEEPIEVTNGNGYTTMYNVWLSTYPQEKATKVVVT